MRERLLRAALVLFADRGFVATTVADITEAADVGKGTFFNYFPTKEHVLAAFGERQLGRIDTALADVHAGTLSAVSALRELPHRLTEEPARSPKLARSLIVAIIGNEGVRAIVRRTLRRGRDRVAQLFVLAQRDGAIRNDRSPQDLARLFQQTVFGALVFWAINQPARLPDSLAGAFELFWSGLQPPEPPSRSGDSGARRRGEL
jgi:AcrR family transcriptional regulator